MTAIPLSLFASPTFLFAADGPAQDAAPLLRRAREAVGIDRLRAAKGRVVLSGTADFHGVASTFRLESALDGRFVVRVDGRLPRTTCFDGKSGWIVDASGMPLALSSLDLDEPCLSWWFVTSAWLAEGAPLDVERDGELRLVVRRRGSVRTASIALDAATGRPTELTIATSRGRETWWLADWRDDGGLLVPHELGVRSSGLASTFRVAAVSTTADAPSFAMPEEPRDTAVDAKAPERVAVERADTGHLLVRPRVNGVDVGWFVLDSGAGATVIAPAAADAAQCSTFGKTPLPGAGAEVQICPFRGARSLELGPARVTASLPLVQMDMAPLSKRMGRELAGIVGYDLFRRTIVAIDMTEPRVEIHDREGFARGGLAWAPLVLKGRHPHVRARFEGDREGLFRIDTGAGSTGVMLHAPAVERLKLLEGRETQDVRFAGAGGMSTGKLGALAWLELAGERVEKPMTIFALPGSGALDDPQTEGTIGGGIVGRFTMWLDYGRGRIAFERRATAPR